MESNFICQIIHDEMDKVCLAGGVNYEISAFELLKVFQESGFTWVKTEKDVKEIVIEAGFLYTTIDTIQDSKRVVSSLLDIWDTHLSKF